MDERIGRWTDTCVCVCVFACGGRHYARSRAPCACRRGLSAGRPCINQAAILLGAPDTPVFPSSPSTLSGPQGKLCQVDSHDLQRPGAQAGSESGELPVSGM